MRLLIADDEADIRALIRIYFMEKGYQVTEAADGETALGFLTNGKAGLGGPANGEFDLAILDVMMPRLDGFNLLRELRKLSRIPVILLTARGEEMDKLLGLGLGADDYLAKPFSLAELGARVEAHLRRRNVYDQASLAGITGQSESAASPGAPVHKLICGKLILDREGCTLYRDGVPITLIAKEYKVLECLMASPNRIFTKKALYAAVWEDEFYADDNTVMVTMSRLRSKLEEDPQQPVYLATVRGLGYKFSGVVLPQR